MKDKPIRWPKPKSESDLCRLNPRQVIEYARRLHVAWAEKHRREMVWDLFWAEFYRKQLKGTR